MTVVEKLERSVRWSRAHRGDADARAPIVDGVPRCIVCGGRIVRTHGGAMPKTCADCREIHRAGWELSRRGVDGDSLVVAIERAAARLAKTSAKRGYTPYSVRRKRIAAAGTERMTTWRGRPCMGGSFVAPSARLAPAWDAPSVPKSIVGKKKRKGGLK